MADYKWPSQGSAGVTTIDGISGAVTLVTGTGITITDNSPVAGDITIASISGGDVTIGNFSSTPSAKGLTISGAQVLNMDPADATHPGGVSILAQSFAGAKTFADTLTATTSVKTPYLYNASNVIIGDLANAKWNDWSGNPFIIGSTHQISNGGTILADFSGGMTQLNRGARLTSNDLANTVDLKVVDGGFGTFPTYWMPKSQGAASTFLMTDGTDNSGNLSWSNTPATSFAPVGTSPSANGATISAGVITLQPADATHPGVVSILTQHFAGQKHFDSLLNADVGLRVTGPTIIIGSADQDQLNIIANATQTSPIIEIQTSALADLMTLDNAGLLTVLNIIDSGLTASQAVVTNGSKQLISLAYASANTATSLVERDGSGNFAAGTITAALTGTASGNTTYSANNHGVVLSSATNAMTVLAPNASTVFPLVSGGTGADPSWALLTVPGGGTGAATLTNHGVLLGQSTSAIVATAAGTSGQPLLSGGASADPAYGTLGISFGGTGQVTKAAAFDALSPMTTGGDIIYGGASGTGTRLANGSSGQFLKSNGTTTAPSWATPTISLTAPTVSIVTPSSHSGGFPSNASGNYTTPAGVLWIQAIVVGGGGGGSGSGTAAGTAATDGADSTFDNLTAAKGIKGAFAGANGGAGGAATVGSGWTDVGSVAGGYGEGSSFAAVTTIQTNGGRGGGNPYNGGGATGGGAGNAPVGATASGQGGGGGGDNGLVNNQSGTGGGAGGYVIATIAPTAGQVFAYVAGANGAAGGAGTGGTAGGAAGAGIIIIREFYQ